jgi:hypothetical protein
MNFQPHKTHRNVRFLFSNHPTSKMLQHFFSSTFLVILHQGTPREQARRLILVGKATMS